LLNFSWSAFAIALISIIVAIIGLGAAYTGYVARPIGKPVFVLLNLFSLSLIFANPVMSAIGVPVVLALVGWHMRPLMDAPQRG